MKKPQEQSESERFKQAARELGCDESEERFDEVIKKVAKHRPANSQQSKPAAKGQQPKGRA